MAQFRVLDNVEGDHVDLVFAPVDPMALSPDGTALYAVNAHGSTVVRFTSTSGTPDKVYSVPWGPVSLAYWAGATADAADDELLVVSRGTYVLTRIAPATGRVLNMLDLPAEPAGILLDPARNHLFVACSAEDLVLEIDLPSNTVFDQFEITTTRHLLFLSKEGSNVLVAPMLSGNNSIAKDESLAGTSDNQAVQGTAILDLADPTVATDPLPDEDLFRLVPGTTPNSGIVQIVAKGLGTNLFAHGIHPTNGKLWCLNTDARNQGDLGRGVDALRTNVFIRNRLTITTLPAVNTLPPFGTGSPATSHSFVDFNDPAATSTVAKPYALAFSSGGIGFAAGASTDNVRVLGVNGQTLGQWNLPVQGSIPRGLLYDDAINQLLVYCWGTNKIELLSLSGAVVATLDVGYDPSSGAEKAGRGIFFDARNSALRHASCESCHVEGLMDFLVWDNSPLPDDDKGPMFTQSLRGIADKRPYHWRGEQADLIDFNGVFSRLFGGTPLSTGPGSDFDKLQTYLFQLENPANPNAHPDRVVSDDRTITKFNPPATVSPTVSAVAGQATYFDVPSVSTATCQSCHTLPTGTVSDFFEDGLFDQHHRGSFDVPAYNGLWRKEMLSRDTVQLAGSSTTETRAPLGSGTTHAGLIPGVFEFVLEEFPQLTTAQRENVAFFLHQVDSGLAPAVHRARLLAQATVGASQGWIAGYLIPQAQARNCDIAVFGEVLLGGTTRSLRWHWDRSQSKFVSDDPTLIPRALAFFVNQATANTGWNVFVGLPVGMGRRWGVDFDRDDLFNVAESVWGTGVFDDDTDGDGFLDGVEVANGSSPTNAGSTPVDTTAPSVTSARLVFKTGRIGKYIFETSEPTRLALDYSDGFGPVRHVASQGWKRLHSVLLRDLEPSYTTTGLQRTYIGNVRAFDQVGNQGTAPLPPATTESFITASESLAPPIAREVRVSLVGTPASTLLPQGYEVVVDATIEDFKPVPPQTVANHAVIARVIVNGARTGNFQILNKFGNYKPAPTQLAYTVPGGFNPIYAVPSADGYAVGTVSAASGVSTLKFLLPSANAGDAVRISIETAGAADPAAWNPMSPLFLFETLFELPSTAAPNRASVEITL